MALPTGTANVQGQLLLQRPDMFRLFRIPGFVSLLLLAFLPFFQAFFPSPQLAPLSALPHHICHQSLGLPFPLLGLRKEKDQGPSDPSENAHLLTPCPVWLDCSCFLFFFFFLSERGMC